MPDRAAQKGVKRWEFIPARKGDKAIEMKVRIPISFKIKRK